MRIKNKKHAEEIYNYCKDRLPILEGFSLTVEAPTDINDKSIIKKGVHLIVKFGNKTISKWSGIDEDDALLCIYKDLVYYYKNLAEEKPQTRPALGKTHYAI